MNKRLKKKKRRGPFREFGITLTVRLRQGADFNDFLDDFILNAVEANRAYFGGGGGPPDWKLEGIIELGRRGESLEAKRDAILRWLKNHSSVQAYRAGEPFDLWLEGPTEP